MSYPSPRNPARTASGSSPPVAQAVWPILAEKNRAVPGEQAEGAPERAVFRCLGIELDHVYAVAAANNVVETNSIDTEHRSAVLERVDPVVPSVLDALGELHRAAGVPRGGAHDLDAIGHAVAREIVAEEREIVGVRLNGDDTPRGANGSAATSVI